MFGLNYLKLWQQLKQHEGCINHMYLDSVGIVTVGVGHAIFNHNMLDGIKFIYKHNGQLACSADVKAEYNYIKTYADKNYNAKAFDKLTKLELAPNQSDKLFAADLNQAIYAVNNYLTRLKSLQFFTIPQPAMHAMVSMTFNMGHTKFLGGNKWPKFKAALKKRDWQECAIQTNYRGPSKQRIADLKECFMHAARIEQSLPRF